MKDQIDWQNLKYFMALAKTLSLAKASKVTKSNHVTVSRRVKALEEELKVRLFEVTPQGHTLTPTGEFLYEQCSSVETQIDTVTRKIFGMDAQISGEIRLTTTDSLSRLIVSPLIYEYQQKYPEIGLRVLVGNKFANLSKREADIAIRPSMNPPPNLIGRRLGRLKFAVYAAPQYLKDNPVDDYFLDWKQHKGGTAG